MKFLNMLESPRPLLSDGAMGTILHQRGIDILECFDALNLSHPNLVAEVHQEYIEAGSNIIQTNTFGANRYKLSRHGLENKVAEINQSAVELARRLAVSSSRNVLVAGDIGPLGIRLAPFGRVQPEQARQVFREQIKTQVETGIDLLIIETMTDLHEAAEALTAAREISRDLPIVVSMTFTRDDRTLLGDSPVRVAKFLQQAGANLIGINCSGGPNQILRLLKEMRSAVPEGRYSVMPNAGWPEQVGGRIMYPAGPEYFGEYIDSFCEAGASLIGGCCGTTAAHIKAMSKALLSKTSKCQENIIPITTPSIEDISPSEPPTQLAQKIGAKKFVIAVEMDPPRGLSTHKLLAGAALLAESGADVINVADSPMARMRMSPWAVCSLLQNEIHVETVLHFPTRGRNLLRVQGDLLAAHALNVRNVFVVMGDPTSIGDYPNAMDNYDLVPSGLIKLIKQNFNSGLDHAGADIGQPTNFFVGAALNLTPPDPATEIKNLRRKLKAGVDFLLTQPIFDPLKARSFLDLLTSELGSEVFFPILVGIMPLVSIRHATYLHQEVPGISIPEDLQARMEKAADSGAQEGVKIAIELIESVRDFAQGVYLIPSFNRFDYASEIIEAVR
jgi:methionine synthase / methylenetetrahydrofolate reductase(NADPH)